MKPIPIHKHKDNTKIIKKCNGNVKLDQFQIIFAA
jgi:hypothetical protein